MPTTNLSILRPDGKVVCMCCGQPKKLKRYGWNHIICKKCLRNKRQKRCSRCGKLYVGSIYIDQLSPCAECTSDTLAMARGSDRTRVQKVSPWQAIRHFFERG